MSLGERTQTLPRLLLVQMAPICTFVQGWGGALLGRHPLCQGKWLASEVQLDSRWLLPPQQAPNQHTIRHGGPRRGP